MSAMAQRLYMSIQIAKVNGDNLMALFYRQFLIGAGFAISPTIHRNHTGVQVWAPSRVTWRASAESSACYCNAGHPRVRLAREQPVPDDVPTRAGRVGDRRARAKDVIRVSH